MLLEFPYGTDFLQTEIAEERLEVAVSRPLNPLRELKEDVEEVEEEWVLKMFKK